MTNKTVLITGASSGIGRATAQLLAQKGFTIFGTSRNPEKLDPLPNVRMLPLDVRDDESVRACVTAVLEQSGRIDILINNAGYVLAGAVEEASMDQAQALFETNFFGTLRMIKAVLPKMRQQGEGQIINIGSLVSLLPIPFWGVYNASKSAVAVLSDSLRQDLLPLNIRVSVVEPGFFQSGLGNNTQVGAEPIGDYDIWRERAFQRHREEEENAPNPQIVAETVLKIVESKSPRLRYLVGKEVRYHKLGKVMTSGMEEKARRNYWKLDV